MGHRCVEVVRCGVSGMQVWGGDALVRRINSECSVAVPPSRGGRGTDGPASGLDGPASPSSSLSLSGLTNSPPRS